MSADSNVLWSGFIDDLFCRLSRTEGGALVTEVGEKQLPYQEEAWGTVWALADDSLRALIIGKAGEQALDLNKHERLFREAFSPFLPNDAESLILTSIGPRMATVRNPQTKWLDLLKQSEDMHE